MLATVPSAALVGLEVCRVRVEVSITRGTPLIQIVGLAESAVREGRERIRAAAVQLGLHVPGLRITVNLAPAGVRKHGAAFDLPILVGILAAAGQLPAARVGRWAMAGELGLDGRLRPVRGALPIALHAARVRDVRGLLLPAANLREAAPARRLEVRGARDLGEVLGFLRGEKRLPAPGDLPDNLPGRAWSGSDLRSVRGQEHAKRALEIAAAGGHNLLLSGEPGAGKTTLARCLPSLLPDMSHAEAVEVTAVHSVAGHLPPGSGLLRHRPFRSPHHTISEAGLIGGGRFPGPGEVSLAHRGVLFLDELPEFNRRALEVLRGPLEEGRVHIVRVGGRATFPARFTLVAAMNPCPCGYHGSRDEHRCACDPTLVARYLRRVSGPLLDRIDLHVEVPAVTWEELTADREGEPSAAVRARVTAARERAARRLGEPRAKGDSGSRSRFRSRASLASQARSNAELSPEELARHCRPDAGGLTLLKDAVERFGLSARGYHRVLRVARTIADLAGEEQISGSHVAQAVGFRVPERQEVVSRSKVRM